MADGKKTGGKNGGGSSGSALPEKINPTSLYYLSSNDNPGFTITNVDAGGCRDGTGGRDGGSGGSGGGAGGAGGGVHPRQGGGNVASGLPGMTPTQWKRFLNLLSSSAGQPMDDRMVGLYSLLPWILDTGASNHVTGDLSLLSDVSTVPDCTVGLPDGKKVVATKCGSVSLASHITLHDVLFVPGLNCNLISISQLIDNVKCVVQFTHNLCVLQDPTTRMVIGAGERRDGLYYFHTVPSAQTLAVKGLVSLELWHQRLGHPSERVVKSIPVAPSCNSSMSKAFDVCHRAKQTRDKFIVSESRASSIFELVHCDRTV